MGKGSECVQFLISLEENWGCLKGVWKGLLFNKVSWEGSFFQVFLLAKKLSEYYWMFLRF